MFSAFYHTYNFKNIALCFVMLAFFLLGDATLCSAANAPGFLLPSVTDTSIVDARDYRGKIVLVNFWATSCRPCRLEIPALMRLQEQFGPQGFSVIGISMDRSMSRVSNFVERKQINYPVVMGDSKVAKDFGGIFGVPVSFLFDRAGNLIQSYPGLVDHKVFERDINALMH
ncbi:MAG: TlpA family protein disulfide reductase [Desulfobulbaceae bacterium]|nr:TlpA family protein disulfide reductase [Desulfobulbaceae bacterium]